MKDRKDWLFGGSRTVCEQAFLGLKDLGRLWTILTETAREVVEVPVPNRASVWGKGLKLYTIGSLAKCGGIFNFFVQTRLTLDGLSGGNLRTR